MKKASNRSVNYFVPSYWHKKGGKIQNWWWQMIWLLWPAWSCHDHSHFCRCNESHKQIRTKSWVMVSLVETGFKKSKKMQIKMSLFWKKQHFWGDRAVESNWKYITRFIRKFKVSVINVFAHFSIKKSSHTLIE